MAARSKQNEAKPRSPRGLNTHISMAVDRSGSMKSMGSGVREGVNHYLDQQRRFCTDTASSTDVLLSVFDDEFSIVHNTNLAEM